MTLQMSKLYGDRVVKSGVIFATGTEWEILNLKDEVIKVGTLMSPAKHGPYAYLPNGNYHIKTPSGKDVYVTEEGTKEYLDREVLGHEKE